MPFFAKGHKAVVMGASAGAIEALTAILPKIPPNFQGCHRGATMNLDSPVKFLLVNDMDENLLALEGLLRRDGLEILKAKCGNEALELLLENDVALAVLDVQMPEMDGFELAEVMRGSLRTRHIPIIFLTAGGLDDRRKFRGYEADAVDFLFKPIEPAIIQGKADLFYELFRHR